MPIPDLDATTGFLPPGDWTASLGEVEERFGVENRRRRERFADAAYVIGQLWSRGATRIWLGGSFVTAKLLPRDVDITFEAPASKSPDTWGIYSGLPLYRKMMKDRHHVDLWRMPSYQRPPGGVGSLLTIKELWSRKEGSPKGLLELQKENEGGSRDD